MREDVQEEAQEEVMSPTMLEELRRKEAERHHSVPGELRMALKHILYSA